MSEPLRTAPAYAVASVDHALRIATMLPARRRPARVGDRHQARGGPVDVDPVPTVDARSPVGRARSLDRVGPVSSVASAAGSPPRRTPS